MKKFYWIIIPVVILATLATGIIVSADVEILTKFDRVTLLNSFDMGTDKTILTGVEAESKIDAIELGFTLLPDKKSTVVWMKDITFHYPDGSSKVFTYNYDTQYLPTNLSEEELLEYWGELQALAMESEIEELTAEWDNMKQDASYTIQVTDTTTGETTDKVMDSSSYSISGRYNTNPFQ